MLAMSDTLAFQLGSLAGVVVGSTMVLAALLVSERRRR